jgi:transcriptional regulator with XRE-family HTH domain
MSVCAILHGMTVKRTATGDTPRFRAPFLRPWREHFGWSQEHVVEQIERVTGGGYTLTAVSLGRIERGHQPYNQELMEALEKVFALPAAVLLFRDPAEPDADWDMWESLTPAERATVQRVIRAVRLPPTPSETEESAPSGARKSSGRP